VEFGYEKAREQLDKLEADSVDGDDSGDSEYDPEEDMEKAASLLRAGGKMAKNVAEAIAIYDAIIEQDESYPGVWRQRGFAKLLGFQYFDAEFLDEKSFENYNQVLPDLNRAIEEDEEDGSAYAYRAEIHRRCGRNDEALEDLQRAFDLDGEGWPTTAFDMYDQGITLPEEIIQGLRDTGYIEDDEEDEEDEDE
jgi:tetratricopeptide (TPR) repeat protein